MATLSELAKQYLKELKESTNKATTAKKISQGIKGLVYSTTNKPLSLEDRKKIVVSMRELLEERIIVEAADNTEYLNLIDQILKDVEGK